MPRGAPTPTMPSPSPLAADALDLAAGLSYPDLLARAGAYRDPRRGVVHALPYGAPYRKPANQGGGWAQRTRAYPVAMSAEEAREKTRATGERHDWYSPGLDCPKCTEPLVGWVLGGRKFQIEHDHVTDFDPQLYGEIEAAPPEESDADPSGAPMEG